MKQERNRILILMLVVAALSSAIIWLRTSTVKETYRYIQLEKEFQTLQQETQAARIQWLKLTETRRLERVATKLGLQRPERKQVYRYGDTPKLN